MLDYLKSAPEGNYLILNREQGQFWIVSI